MAKKKIARKAVTISTRLSAVECSQDAVVEAVTNNDVMLARVVYRLGMAEGLERRIVHLESILAEGHAKLGEPLEAYMARREAEPPNVDVEHLRCRIEDLEAGRLGWFGPQSLLQQKVDTLERAMSNLVRDIARRERPWYERLTAWCKRLWARASAYPGYDWAPDPKDGRQ